MVIVYVLDMQRGERDMQRERLCWRDGGRMNDYIHVCSFVSMWSEAGGKEEKAALGFALTQNFLGWILRGNTKY